MSTKRSQLCATGFGRASKTISIGLSKHETRVDLVVFYTALNQGVQRGLSSLSMHVWTGTPKKTANELAVQRLPNTVHHECMPDSPISHGSVKGDITAFRYRRIPGCCGRRDAPGTHASRRSRHCH